MNKDEAPLAQHIFDRYLALDSVKKLMHELERDGKTSPARVSQRGYQKGDAKYSRGALYAILKNPIYIGKIRHKDKIYDGQHEALICTDIWNRVQAVLDKPVGAKTGQEKARHKNLLQGLLFDRNGTLYSPVYTKKTDGKNYRYYVSQNLLQCRDHPEGAAARLPAHEIEQAVITTINKHLSTPALLAKLLHLDEIEDHSILQHMTQIAIDLESLIHHCLMNVVIEPDKITIVGKLSALREYLDTSLGLTIPARSDAATFTLSTGFSTQRSHKGAIILKADTAKQSLYDLPAVELRNLVRGVIWRDRHFAGESIRNIARQEGFSEAGVRKIIMGSFHTLMAFSPDH